MHVCFPNIFSILLAGSLIYISIEPSLSFDDASFEFRAKSCEVAEMNENRKYQLFDLESGVCENPNVDLTISRKDEKFQFSYMVFLFSDSNARTNYTLNCDISICVRNNPNSECSIFDQNC